MENGWYTGSRRARSWPAVCSTSTSVITPIFCCDPEVLEALQRGHRGVCRYRTRTHEKICHPGHRSIRLLVARRAHHRRTVRRASSAASGSCAAPASTGGSPGGANLDGSITGRAGSCHRSDPS